MAKKRSTPLRDFWQELSISNETPLQISRDMMQREWDLSELERAMFDELIQLRVNISTLLKAGAVVEPGAFSFATGRFNDPVVVGPTGRPGGFQKLATG